MLRVGLVTEHIRRLAEMRAAIITREERIVRDLGTAAPAALIADFGIVETAHRRAWRSTPTPATADCWDSEEQEIDPPGH